MLPTSKLHALRWSTLEGVEQMKKLSPIFLVLLSTSLVKADTLNLRMRPTSQTFYRKALPFALLPVSFPIHTALHESSHALAATLQGNKVTALRPYPHNEDGQFRFGYISTEKENGLMFFLAPSIMDVLLFSVSDALLYSKTVNIKSIYGNLLYVFGIVAPLVDFSNGFFMGSDWRRARSLAGGPGTAALNVIGGTIIAFGAYRLILHTIDIISD